MTPAQWNRLKTVFQAALDRPAADRRAWLARECADDSTILREAEALLRSHETAGDFLEQPAQIDPEDVAALVPGTRLGSYAIVRELGRGGMGVVYLADDLRLGRKVAVKALPAVMAENVELRERLRREARAAATISHPSVATIYALEELDDQLVIVSEYVAGGTLRSLIERGPVNPARAAAIAIDIARALCAAHDAGVVHRDLKPENVLLGSDGSVKVMDFGIALVEGPPATRLTRSGAMLGTPAYMAPEQLLGSPADARVDQYALGVVLQEMLTGRHPLSPRRQLPATGSESSACDQLLRVAARCMSADPGARYPNARALLHALESVAAGSPMPAEPNRSARWWWQFHQAVTAVVYWMMVVPAWQGRELIGGAAGRWFFVVTLAAIVVAATLRLHLWFTSRFYPAEHRWARRRVRRSIAVADWTFSASLVSGGLLIGDRNAPLAIVLIAFGIGAAVAFLLIEPVTTRAAFRPPSAREG